MRLASAETMSFRARLTRVAASPAGTGAQELAAVVGFTSWLHSMMKPDAGSDWF